MTHRARVLKRIVLCALAALPAVTLGVLQTQPSAAAQVHTGPVRFAPLDVFVDAGTERLGAWQVEVVPAPEFAGHVTVVGVAGGDLPFNDAPYFDERAIQDERVIIADFDTDADALHPGRSRVAQVQLRITSVEDPEFTVTLHAAARHDGAAIDAAVDAVLGTPAQSDNDDTTENDE